MNWFKKGILGATFSMRYVVSFFVFILLVPFPHECLSLVYGQSNCSKHGMLCNCAIACNAEPQLSNKVSQLLDSGRASSGAISKHKHETFSHSCDSEMCSQTSDSHSEKKLLRIQLSNRPWLVSQMAVLVFDLRFRGAMPVFLTKEIAGYYVLPDFPPQFNFFW